MTNEIIRVLVVDDMRLIHRMLKAMLETDEGIQVVAAANNGKEGIELAEKIKPDVIIMDIHMPVMDGFEATRYLMQYCPTPILIMSSSAILTERNATFEALRAGALDVMEKPDGRSTNNLKEIGAPLVQKIKRFSRIKVIRRVANVRPATAAKIDLAAFKAGLTKAILSKSQRILAIGASTGGPSALVELLENFPKDFPWPIAIVQHISTNFSQSFAEWLGTNLSLPVKLAEDKEILVPGKVYIAGEPKHMTIDASLQVRMVEETGQSFHIPSVDALFTSLAQNVGDKAVGVLLTGMGEDGAKGLLEMYKKGAKTFAQDQETSLVYGMPKKAFDFGAVTLSQPPKEIARAILNIVEKG